MIWCLRLTDTGTFRSASRAGDVAFSLEQWAALDRRAAEDAFPCLALQRRFMIVTGLDSRDAVNASLAGTH